MIVPNRTDNTRLISLGQNSDNFPTQRLEDHRYIFPPSFRLLSMEDSTTLEPNQAPLRDINLTPAGRATSKIIKIGGTVGGSGGIGGWFTGQGGASGPGLGTYVSEGPILSKDDAERTLQRIAEMSAYRGLTNLSLGSFDSRWFVCGLKKYSVVYVDGTDRLAFDIQLDFEAPDPYAYGGLVGSQTYGTDSGTQTFSVGGSARTWPVFDLNVSGTAQVWVGVTYPGGQKIVVQVAPPSAVAGGHLYVVTEPRRRGLFDTANYRFSDRNPVLTAFLNCQNTFEDQELMPYLLPGPNTVSWSSTAAGLTITWPERWAY